MMTDQDFINAFENATLSSFSHRDHLRMAWIYLREFGPMEGEEKIRSGLRHFAQALGVPQKYHETITLFWARLIQHAIEQNPASGDFESLLVLYPFLLDGQSLYFHYSHERLNSAEARQTWMVPDLRPLPTA